MTASALLTALQHGDSAFPSGSFAFSQGLEGQAELERAAGRSPDVGFVGRFLATQLALRWGPADRVALARAWDCAPNLESLAALDREIEASTLVEGFRAGSKRNGAALLASHVRLETPGAGAYRAAVRAGRALGHLAVVQGLVWRALGLGRAESLALSGYGLAAGIASAAVRLGLIGALEAQRLIAEARPEIAAWVERPVAPDAPLESYAPLAEIAVMRHTGAGQPGTRLFSN